MFQTDKQRREGAHKYVPPRKYMSIFRTGIGGKIVITVLAAFIGAFSITGYLVYSSVKEEIVASTKRENQKLSQNLASEVKGSLNEAMSIAQSLAHTMEGHVSGQQKPLRNDIVNILRYLLESNPNLLGIYVGFEPNAFDGLDAEYRNTPGHDETGRFIPYINKLTGEVALDPLVDYEADGVGDYYLIPRKTGREAFLDPFLYEGVLMTSIVVPIKDSGGNFLGIAGVDISLKSLDEMISKIRVLETGNAYLVSNGGTYVSYPNKIMIGSSTIENFNTANIRQAFEAGSGLYVDDATEESIIQIEQMESQVTPEMKETFKKLAAEIKTGKSGMVDFETVLTGQRQWTFYEPVSIGETDTPWSLLVNVTPDEALLPLNKILRNLAAVALGTLLIITVVIVVLSRRIVRPISKTVEKLKEIAQGEGDLTARLQISSNDEAGELARWFNSFVDKLRDIISQVVETATKVEEGSAQLAAAVQQQAVATNQVTVTISQVADGSMEQSQGIGTVQESVEQLSAVITQIARGAQEQAGGVESTTELSDEMAVNISQAVTLARKIGDDTKTNASQAARGNEAAGAVIKSMEKIGSKAEQAVESVAKLDQGSRQIGDIIEVINEIADQTNLLALNAAIEAARAGEHGKGFAVVADEVRKLAEQAKSSTNEISEIIKMLSSAIDSTIDAVQASGEQINDGTSLAKEAGEVLREIETTASQTVTAVSSLLALTDKLEDGSRAVAQAMTGIASIAVENSASAQQMTASSNQVVQATESIANISRQTAAGSQNVASLAEEQNATLEEMAASAGVLADSAAALQKLVSQFKVS